MTVTQRRKVELTDALRKKIVKAYTSGTSIVKVSEELDVPPGAVRRVLDEDPDVTIRPRGRYASK